jgi:cyclase
MTAPHSRHYSFQSLEVGVHAAIAAPRGDSICNSGIVDLGGGILVFDTGLTPGSARDLRDAVVALTGHGPTAVANSHWHVDHSLGNQEFTGVPIWGTRRTREILLSLRDQLAADLSRVSLEKEIQQIEGRRADMRTPGARQDLEFVLQINRALLNASDEIRPTPPDQTFETRLQLPGTRGAELVSFGAGHTEADAVLFLRQERVVYAGDLVCAGIQPSLGSGDPEHWLTVLDEIERLGAERIVPGHGPILAPSGMAEVRGYVSGVLRAAESPSTAPLPNAIQRWEGSLSLEENLKFAREWVARPRAGR